jgi:hypothetical protein
LQSLWEAIRRTYGKRASTKASLIISSITHQQTPKICQLAPPSWSLMHLIVVITEAFMHLFTHNKPHFLHQPRGCLVIGTLKHIILICTLQKVLPVVLIKLQWTWSKSIWSDEYVKKG